MLGPTNILDVAEGHQEAFPEGALAEEPGPQGNCPRQHTGLCPVWCWGRFQFGGGPVFQKEKGTLVGSRVPKILCPKFKMGIRGLDTYINKRMPNVGTNQHPRRCGRTSRNFSRRGPGRGARAPRKLSSATYRTLSCMVPGTISNCENVQFAKEKLQNALLRFERDPGGIQGP